MQAATFLETEAEYDTRYQHGYMDDLGHDSRERIKDFLSACVPSNFSGRILDFGTGNGRYAAILREQFPHAEIYAVDVSDIATDVAARIHAGKNIRFIKYRNLDSYAGTFDLTFSNHVLEHVHDISDIAGLLSKLTAPNGQMVHAMPCGNPGSLEYRIVHMMKDGIRHDLGDSFFFEDPGHLRRITSFDLAQEFAPYDFRVAHAWFSGQFWGTLNWATQSPPSAWRLASPSRAKNIGGALYLSGLKLLLVLLCAGRIAASLPRTHGHVAPEHRGKKLNLVLSLLRPFYYLEKPLDNFLLWKAEREWKQSHTIAAGSEQFMHFTRH